MLTRRQSTSRKRSGYVNGSFSDLPKNYEQKMQNILGQEEQDQVIYAVREELMEKVMDACYKRYIEKQAVKFVVHCAYRALVQLINMDCFHHDPGKPFYSNHPAWEADAPLKPSPIDTWAAYKVNVKPKPIPQSFIKTASVSILETETSVLDNVFVGITAPTSDNQTIYRTFNIDEQSQSLSSEILISIPNTKEISISEESYKNMDKKLQKLENTFTLPTKHIAWPVESAQTKMKGLALTPPSHPHSSSDSMSIKLSLNVDNLPPLRKETEWVYSIMNGPSTWPRCFPSAREEKQSPVDINSMDLKPFNPFQRLSWKYVPENTERITNTGHGWKVDVNGEGSALLGGPLEDEYILEQFHCHWGSSDNQGSEHTINGKQYSGELHLVHWNAKYDSFSEALKHSDGLCVLGVFLKLGRTHYELNKIVDRLSDIQFKNQNVKIDLLIDPDGFIPKCSGYWTYRGSLTTPPYSECVIWIVFQDPIEISREQLKTFRSLRSYCAEDHCPSDDFEGFVKVNFRPTLPLGRREIYAVTGENNVEASHFKI